MVEVRDIDYNLLSFEDQIKNDLETDIMVSGGRYRFDTTSVNENSHRYDTPNVRHVVECFDAISATDREPNCYAGVQND